MPFGRPVRHTKNFSINNFGVPKAPPLAPPNSLCLGCFPCFGEKGDKEFTGVGGPLGGGGGSRRGVSGKILYVYAFFRGLILAGRGFRQTSTLLGNSSPIFRQHEMPSLPRFGHRNRKIGPGFKTLSFLSLVFGKNARKTTKKTRIFYPHQTPKIPGKEGEKRSKKQGIPRKGKNKEIQKKKGKEGQGNSRFSPPRPPQPS